MEWNSSALEFEPAFDAIAQFVHGMAITDDLAVVGGFVARDASYPRLDAGQARQDFDIALPSSRHFSLEALIAAYGEPIRDGYREA